MNIIHFAPKVSDFRFLRSSKSFFYDTFNENGKEVYKYFHNADDFRSTLNSRVGNPDVVIISAHGTESSILIKGQDSFRKAMRIHHARLLKHNFVLAISCSTAKEFGPRAIDENALVYIGFDDSIQYDFKFEGNPSKKFNSILEVIFKKIYQESINTAFERFIKLCLTAKEFSQHLEMNFKLRIRNILKMSLSEIRRIYNVPATEKLEKELRMVIKLGFLGKFNTLHNKITLLGDENYIPWYYIDYLNEEQLEELLTKTEGINQQNAYYKYFLKLLAYKKLNDSHNYSITIEKFEEAMIRTSVEFDSPVTLPKSICV